MDQTSNKSGDGTRYGWVWNSRFLQEGENAVPLEAFELWLEGDEEDPGYHTLMAEVIVDSVTAAKSSKENEDNDNEADEISE